MSTTDNTLIVQTEDKNFLRDTNSKGLMCNNKTELQNHYRRKQFMKKIKEEKMSDSKKIERLENEISEIKFLLLELIRKEK